MNLDMMKHHCTNCMNQIQDVVFKCAECTDFELCMQCYVCGAEIGPHERSHGFEMIDLGTFSLFGKTKKNEQKSSKDDEEMEIDQDDKEIKNEVELFKELSGDFSELINDSFEYNSGDDDDDDENEQQKESEETDDRYYYELDRGQLVKCFEDDEPEDEEAKKKGRVWRALDELELLEAVSRFGYGNWKDISQALSYTLEDITPQEVADHYMIHYVLSDIGDYTWNWKKKIARIVETIKINEARRYFKTTKDTFQDISSADLDSVGFMPKRDDFEREFDNEAESIVSNLTVGQPDDDEVETQFKLAQIDMFQFRLLERFRLKTIVRMYGLVRKYLNDNRNKKESDNFEFKQVSDVASIFKHKGSASVFSPFLRYATKNELQELFLDLQKEYSLKVIIRKLLKYKRMGLTNISEIKEYEEQLKDGEDKSKLENPNLGTDDSQANLDQSSDDESDFTLDEQNLERILTINSPLSFDNSQLQEIISAILNKEQSEEELQNMIKAVDDDDDENDDVKRELKELKALIKTDRDSDKDSEFSSKKKRLKSSSSSESYHLRKGNQK